MDENIIKDILKRYKKKYNKDLYYMDIIESNYPTLNDGETKANIPLNQWGGNWTKNKIIYINKNLKPVKDYYKFKGNINDLKKQLIAHELAHEIESINTNKNFKQEIIDKALKSNFSTEYLDTINKNNKQYLTELFCEYLAKDVLK